MDEETDGRDDPGVPSSSRSEMNADLLRRMQRFPLFWKSEKEDHDDLALEWLVHFEAAAIVPEGSEEKAVDFKSYWRDTVPTAYRLEEDQDCLTPFAINRPVIDCALIEPMVQFLTGGEGSAKLTEFLGGTDRPATICGRVFQVGEATYTCRECGMDPTCVLCADCFKDSAHKTHKYKIATSSGGGYCDCGDTEAWRAHVHCNSHMPKEDMEVCDCPEAEGLDERAVALFTQVIQYCYEMTTSDLTTRLPDALIIQREEQEASDQMYCTVLYNDETHTFDLVIQTLTRALACTKKDAIEYATVIDREGRSIVKVSRFQPCLQVQEQIERQTGKSGSKPLKVVVMKAQVIAHQAFALRLLNWLESVCSQSAKLRQIVAEILLSPEKIVPDRPSNMKYIEGIILSDTKLWKSARTCWHRLVISALLKDYENKKQFATVFTKHYADMMKDFIQDDHDHSFSITSLSVQIFTVPSIAHYLVEEHDVLYTIMRTLLSECEQRLNIKNKLEFDRGSAHNSLFKRTNFAILDLKYVLSSPPTEWSESMVKNITRTIDSFLKLLYYMQEMDSVTRQMGQHMEYEPEWESAFNFHIKLMPVVQLSLEWCGSNKAVFIRAFRHCLYDISRTYSDLKDHTVTLEIADHAVMSYLYDISTAPVSVHLPLTRYFAALYLFLEKFGLEFGSSEFNLTSLEKPGPEIIMEPALRTQILIAQVHAGMWKRNGYALLNQLYFYHNVRCRTHMLDRDIATLQIAASLIESNEFVLHLVNRFELIRWADKGLTEQDLKQSYEEDMNIAIMSDEFFGLIITIISARYNPGIGQVSRTDCVKKEVIQQLCVEPMTHSTLNKTLVENVNYETGLELVVQEVANQNQPTIQRTSVVYELKPEYFKEYDLYHYHFTREEMSKAEERQRERKRQAKEPEIFPPPKLPPFRGSFDMIVNILQSDVMLYIIWLVLSRATEPPTRLTTESVVRKVLHLIGLGLNEELTRNEKETGHFFQFTEKAKRWNVWKILDEMLQNPSTSQYVDMIVWIKQQYALIKPSESPCKEITQPASTVASEEEERQRKAKVKEAKEKMMATMAAAQLKFMTVNKELFVEEGNLEDDQEAGNTRDDVEMAPVETVALGPNKTVCYIPEERYTCILCQADQPLVVASKKFVLAAFVQRSTVLSENKKWPFRDCYEQKGVKYLEKPFPLYMHPEMASAPYVSSCGHIMHESCWASHIEAVYSKERRRPYRHPLSFDVDKREWLCPMCDSICNAALPMAAPLEKMYPVPPWGRRPYYIGDVLQDVNPWSFEEPPPPLSFDLWVQALQSVVRRQAEDGASLVTTNSHEKYLTNTQPKLLKYLYSSTVRQLGEEFTEQNAKALEVLYPRRPAAIDPSDQTYKWLNSGFYDRLNSFMELTYTAGLEYDTVLAQEEDFRIILMFWQSLTFSITAVEAYHRDLGITFFGDEVPNRKAMGLKYLTRACGVSIDRKRQFHQGLKTFAIRLLTTLLQNPANTPSIFECDAFSLLVNLTFAMPDLLTFPARAVPTLYVSEEEQIRSADACQPPTGTILDNYILRLIYMYHVTQVLVSNEFPHCIRSPSSDPAAPAATEEPMEIPEEAASSKPIATRKEYIFGEVWRISQKPNVPWNNIELVDCELVWETIKEATIPFLRCAAKLYENITGIAPSKSLETVESRFDDLMHYLGLPKTFEELFDSPCTWQMPYKWASHPETAVALKHVHLYGSTGPERIIQYPRRLKKLVDLPDDYTELINMVSNFTCTNCNTLDSRTPTMCLVCGEILCSQSYCCQRELKGSPVGACVYHAYHCGAGYGIFLRIRECKIFLIGGKNKGCFLVPPYLDEYGEPDQGLRRGNPLTLCKEKYEGFRKIWLQHGIPEEIARVTEHSSTVIATEWQYL